MWLLVDLSIVPKSYESFLGHPHKIPLWHPQHTPLTHKEGKVLGNGIWVGEKKKPVAIHENSGFPVSKPGASQSQICNENGRLRPI